MRLPTKWAATPTGAHTTVAGSHVEGHVLTASWRLSYELWSEEVAESETFLLMNDDATVTKLTRCNDCKYLFADIDKHVAESVTVPAVDNGERFIVRLWDMFDGWIDITGPQSISPPHELLTRAEAEEIWNKHTNNGTEKITYADGDYYAIFPADTRMFFTPERLGR